MLPVVSADDHYRLIQPSALAQLFEKCPHQFILGGNFSVIHAVESNLVHFIHAAHQGSVPAEDVAVEVAQVALCLFTLQEMWSVSLNKFLRGMVGHMHAH